MGLTFKKVIDSGPVVDYLVKTLTSHLNNGEKVLWFATGGSAIGVAAQVSKQLAAANVPLDSLTATLTDERFGPVGHPDSNSHQLEQAGFLGDPILKPVLDGQDLATTTRMFSDWLKSQLEIANYRIALFGIGPDGHIAGLLPGSPALHSNDLAACYKDDEVTVPSPSGVKRGLDRITMTPSAIAMLDEAIVYTIGEGKWSQLDRLRDNLNIGEQPSQVLKQVPKVLIFNDHY